jgi:hypothetical protein
MTFHKNLVGKKFSQSVAKATGEVDKGGSS